MTKSKPLTKRQLGLLEALFVDDQEEQKVLDKCKVDRKLFNKWMTEPAFIEQLDRHSAAAYRRSVLRLARFVPEAASRLVRLSEQGTGETTRKACLDVISSQNLQPTADRRPETKDHGRTISDELSPEAAGHILAALAKEKACR